MFIFHRKISPLNVNRIPETNEQDDLNDEVSAIESAKNIPRLLYDLCGGDGTESAALHIKNVEKLFVITNNKKLDEATPMNSTPAPPPPPQEKKKKHRRNRYNRNK